MGKSRVIRTSCLRFLLEGPFAGILLVLLACNCSDNSTGSPQNIPPDTPILTSPADGTVATPTSIELRWTASDPNGDALSYSIYFDTLNSPTQTVENNVAGNSYIVSGLSQGTTYFWSIVAHDPKGASSSSSAINRFTVGSFDLGWTELSPMPTARIGVASTATDDRLFVFGGLSTSAFIDNAEAYDPLSDSWQVLVPMPTARAFGEAVTLDGKIYVIGGVSNGIALSTVERYDIATEFWQAVAPLPTGRTHFAACALNNRIYVFGGLENETDILAYDLALDKWDIVGELDAPLGGMSATPVGGEIYLVGGFASDNFWRHDLVVYNPNTGQFSSRAPMPTGRHSHRTSLANGKLYVTGGLNAEFVHIFFATLEVYDIATDTWITRSRMNIARHDHAAGAINGKIYVAGGLTDELPTDVTNHTEVYDPLMDP